MKTKALVSLVVGAGAVLLTSSGLAGSMMPFEPGMHYLTGYSQAPLLHVSAVTPGGKKISLDEVKLYAGKSCSSLKLHDDIRTIMGSKFEVSSESVDVISGMLIAFVDSGLGCVKADLIYNGKTYSSGPVALTWDASRFEYTAATPNSVTFDFSS